MFPSCLSGAETIYFCPGCAETAAREQGGHSKALSCGLAKARLCALTCSLTQSEVPVPGPTAW